MVAITLLLANIGYFGTTKWFWKDIVDSPRHFLFGFFLYFLASVMDVAVFGINNNALDMWPFGVVALTVNGVILIVHHLVIYLIWTEKVKQQRLAQTEDDTQEQGNSQ